MHALHAAARTSVWRRRCFRVATSSSSILLVARAASASPAAASRSACMCINQGLIIERLLYAGIVPADRAARLGAWHNRLHSMRSGSMK